MNSRVDLEAMTKPQLIELGKTLSTPVLLDVPHKKGDMVDAILRATGQEVEPAKTSEKPIVETSARDLPPLRKLGTLDGSPTSGVFYDLTIHSTENDRGRVPVGINGYNYLMERDVKHRVPQEVVEVLRNSKINTVRYNPQTRRNEPATVMTYPFDAQRV